MRFIEWLRAFLLTGWNVLGGVVVAAAAYLEKTYPDKVGVVPMSYTILGSLIFAFIVAAYRAWDQEHRKYQEEYSRNQRPELVGEFEVDIQKPASGSIACTCKVTVTNIRPATTSLESILITASDGTRNSTTRSLERPGTITLIQGVAQTVRERAFFDHPITRVRVVVRDGFGGEHQIPIRAAVPGLDALVRSQIGAIRAGQS